MHENTNMKRYIIFAWMRGVKEGGVGDKVGSADTLDEANTIANHQIWYEAKDVAQVYDAETEKVVAQLYS